MSDNNGFELELNEETYKMLEEYAKKNGKSEEEVVEYIICEYLQNQLSIIQDIAKKENQDFNTLLNRQFARLVEMLYHQNTQI